MTARRPNVLVVMTDDHGRWANGCYGHPLACTPTIDWIGATGARFDRAYTPSPVCSPARACFFTGHIPSAHGIHDWIHGALPAPAGGWLSGQPTLGTRLQQAGYRTGLVGKWHCGGDANPQAGFDYWCSFPRGQYPHFGSVHLAEQGRPFTTEGWQAPILTGKALDFLRRPGPDGAGNPDQPFFLFVGYNNTHSPFKHQPEHWVEHYRRRLAAVPATSPDWPEGWVRFGVPSDEATRLEWMAQYLAAVSHIDEQVGALVNELTAQNRLQDTLVVYTSDHGHMNGQHGLYTKGNATVPVNFFEESILVPLVARHPTLAAGGAVCVRPVDHLDLHRTLLAVAGATSSPAPGSSWLPLLADPTAPWRELQFCEYGNSRMVRSDRWKYVKRYPAGEVRYSDQLFDLACDPGEAVNRIGDTALSAEIARFDAELERHFGAWEQPARSGRNILDQPRCNPNEPWRLHRPLNAPSVGSDYRDIADY